HVHDIMKPGPLTISPRAGFSEIAEKFVATRFNYLYVADRDRFLGAVSLRGIATRRQKLPEYAGARESRYCGRPPARFHPGSPTRCVTDRSTRAFQAPRWRATASG